MSVLHSYLELRHGSEHGTLAFMGKTMALDSTVGCQMFDLPKDVGLAGPPEGYVRILFDSKEELEKSAKLFREGFTNKERFRDSLTKLLDKKKLDKTGHVRLTNLINSCDCSPALIREKVKALGYGELLEWIEFEDPRPEFTMPIDFLWNWSEQHKPEEKKTDTKKEEPTPESKSSSKRVAALKASPREQQYQEYMGTSTPGYSDTGIPQKVLEIPLKIQSKNAIDHIDLEITVHRKEKSTPEEFTKEKEVVIEPASNRLKQSESRLDLGELQETFDSKEEFTITVIPEEPTKEKMSFLKEVVDAVDSGIAELKKKKGRKKK